MKQQLQERWRALGARERQLLSAAAVVVLCTAAFLGVIEPLQRAQAKQSQALQEARTLAARLEEIAAAVQQSRGQSANAALRSVSLLAAVDQSAKQSALGKPPSRIQPDGEKQVKVWFDKVPFDALARWLHDLETRYGVFTQAADIERESTAGAVSAQITLVRP